MNNIKKMVNFSNHKSATWSDSQKQGYDIVDIPFPVVSPTATNLDDLVNEYVSKIIGLKPDVAMIQGEMTLVFKIVTELKKKGIVCVASCTNREVKETVMSDGSVKKESVFKFVQFREY